MYGACPRFRTAFKPTHESLRSGGCSIIHAKVGVMAIAGER
jgi:hypothetical protein